MKAGLGSEAKCEQKAEQLALGKAVMASSWKKLVLLLLLHLFSMLKAAPSTPSTEQVPLHIFEAHLRLGYIRLLTTESIPGETEGPFARNW